MRINPEEIRLAEHCLAQALAQGASAARISLSKSVTDSFALLDGELDKVTRCTDRSIFMHLYVDGRYGTYSTDRLEREELDTFVRQTVAATRLLAPDPLRSLPDPSRCAKDAVTGLESGLYDPEYETLEPQNRLELAMASQPRVDAPQGCRIASIESEYSDNIDDNLILDSNGLRARHTETSFSVCCEVTLEDSQGRKYSGYWWEASAFLGKLRELLPGCLPTAVERAAAQVGQGKARGGRRTMVVDRTVSSRLVAPLFSALYGMAVQQKSSFLEGCLGEKVFSEGLTIMDLPRERGMNGARLFDTEGVATLNRPVIEKGRVGMYFLDNYSAGKLGTEPTIEGPSVPVLMPYAGEGCNIPGNEINLPRILKECRNGILVTGFNGGNCNGTTGDFSYGVEGFTFSRGKIRRPVHGLVVTGNMKDLWSSLLMAGSDARKCSRWQIPTLAFGDVSFSS